MVYCCLNFNITQPKYMEFKLIENEIFFWRFLQSARASYLYSTDENQNGSHIKFTSTWHYNSSEWLQFPTTISNKQICLLVLQNQRVCSHNFICTKKRISVQFLFNQSHSYIYRCHASARSKIDEDKIKNITVMNPTHNHWHR